jgi:VanZ family protein
MRRPTDSLPKPIDPVLAARLRALSGIVLVCYWLAMLTGTHWPNFHLEHYPENTDKVLHFSGYGGLSFLIALWWTLRSLKPGAGPLYSGYIGWREAAWIMAVIVGYSIFDEVTQPLFGRDCEFLDAVADWAGGILGLGAFKVLAGALRRFSGR